MSTGPGSRHAAASGQGPPAHDAPQRDPGLARERTALAWQRIALTFGSLSAVTLGVAARRDAAWMVVPAVAVFTVAVVLWVYQRRLAASQGPADRGRAAPAALAVATAGAALLAAVILLSATV